MTIFRKTALVLGGVFVAFLILEGYLRLAMPQNFRNPAGMYIEDSDAGYVLTPGFEGYITRAEYKAFFLINQTGYRGAELRPHQPNTYRILVLGDSQSFGTGVLNEETFSVKLEELLSKAYPKLDLQVVNGGVPGYGTADQLALLLSRGADLEPDLVIVQFLSVNDLIENRSPAKEWATISNGRLISKDENKQTDDSQTEPVWLSLKRWLKGNSHLARITFDTLGYLGTRFGVFGDVDSLWGEDFTEQDALHGSELLVQIAQAAEEQGAQSMFVYTTGQNTIFQDLYEVPRSASVVANAALKSGVPWIDISAKLNHRADKSILYYPKDGHWTPQGHRAVAEILAEEIVALQLLEKED